MSSKITMFDNLVGVCAQDFCIEKAVKGDHCTECTMMLHKREKLREDEDTWVAAMSENDVKKREMGIYPSRSMGNHSVAHVEAIQAGSKMKAARRRAREVAKEADEPVGSEIDSLMGIDHPMVSREQMAHVIDSALGLDVSSAESRSFDAADV